MSWSSDCEEYRKEVRESVRNGERVDMHILDSNLMILETLAGMADMLEEIRSERIVTPALPDLPKDYTPPMTAVYAAPVYPMNYEVDVSLERSEDGKES